MIKYKKKSSLKTYVFQKILIEKKKSDQCRYVLNRMKRWRLHLQEKNQEKKPESNLILLDV